MSYRNLEINGETWKYKVGSSFLDIRNPDGKGFRPTCWAVNGTDVVTFERGQHKRTGDGVVRPGQVRAWIAANAMAGGKAAA